MIMMIINVTKTIVIATIAIMIKMKRTKPQTHKPVTTIVPIVLPTVLLGSKSSH